MFKQFNTILENLLRGRVVDEMSTKEAKEVVGKYYLQVALMTLGNKNQKSCDYIADEVLVNHGLEYFVAA